MADISAVDQSLELTQGLTEEEDDELRRLNYLMEIGTLAGPKLERLFELRLRDRRGDVRPPREFIEEEQRAEAVRAESRFFAWRNR